MTRQLSFRRKLSLAFLVACTFLALGAWAVLAATTCSNPRAPVPETQHVIPHNCHGMTVYISSVQESLLHWLFPVFLLLSLMTAATALLTIVKVRINVEIKVNE